MKKAPTKFLSTFLPLSVVLTILGLGGLLIVIRATLPTLGPRWLFFFLGVLGLTGLSLPLIFFLQALWVGVFGSTIVWLQLGRVLTGGLALILSGVFVLIEFLLRLFERSRWNPKKDSESN